MKKIFYIFMASLIVLTMMLMSACGSDKDSPETDSNTEHTHYYVEGVCSCGNKDPNYEQPHVHLFVNGLCDCGEKDPEYKILNNIVFNGFEVVEDEIIKQYYLLKVGNLYDDFDASELIYSSNNNVKLMLFSDIECTQLVEVNNIALEYGKNNFYILLEQDGFESEFVNIVFYRKHQCIVTFDNGITYFVDEGDIIEPPIPDKEGFEFVEWNYDFSKPITEDLYIEAIYKSKTINIYFVDNNGNLLAETIEAQVGDIIKLPKPDNDSDVEKWEFGGDVFGFGDEFTVPYFDIYFHPFTNQ